MVRPTFESVWELLNMNQYFQGVFGPRGESSLTKTEKGRICGKITKDLQKCFDLNGDEFFTEVMSALHWQLIKMNWFARNQKGELFGPWPLWRTAYKQASRKAAQKIKSQPQPIQKTMEELLGNKITESLN